MIAERLIKEIANHTKLIEENILMYDYIEMTPDQKIETYLDKKQHSIANYFIQIRFQKDYELIIYPKLEGQLIKKIGYAGLYKKNKLEALISEDFEEINRFMTTTIKFWTQSKIHQEKFAEYLELAYFLGSKLKSEKLEDKDSWNKLGVKILAITAPLLSVIPELKDNQLQQFTNNPNIFKNKVYL